jgi:hypothetical protein
MIIFHFIFKILKNPILKVVDLNIKLKNTSTCTRCLIIKNELHVNKILIF